MGALQEFSGIGCLGGSLPLSEYFQFNDSIVARHMSVLSGLSAIWHCK